MIDFTLVTAADLERLGILKKGTAYRMAKLGLIPFCKVGPKRRGIRFSPRDVLAALGQPANSHAIAVADNGRIHLRTQE